MAIQPNQTIAFALSVSLLLALTFLHSKTYRNPPVRADLLEKLTEDDEPSESRLKKSTRHAISQPVEIATKKVRQALNPNFLVAVASATLDNTLIPNQTSPRGRPNLIILDGSKSSPADGSLTYIWKQLDGPPLKLQPAAMSKDRVGIRIYVPGKFKFQLSIFNEKEASETAEVEIEIPPDKP